jgi:hypothetical protein
MVVNPSSRTTNIYLDLEFYELHIQYMNRQRQKITVRGRLTAEEDRRLDEIDSEVDYYQSRIEELYTPKNNLGVE